MPSQPADPVAAADTAAAFSAAPVASGGGLGPGPGDAVGPYRLLSLLGEGGMGRVFRAEQRHPVRREVALKLIRRGLDTERVIARFEAERRALARMQHPGIASALDAGATADGGPWFAMELVEGRPVTAFADAERLGVDERLRLFGRVCDAVLHAHRRGVLHRDLKPANVLAFRGEGGPGVKVIDFGVARALGPDAEDAGLTEPGAAVGTRAAMSPEQAAGDRDLDVRADVYALGALFFELLVGEAPPAVTPAGGDPPAAPRVWAEAPRVRRRDAAAARATDPDALARRLDREPGWIAAAALRRDRRERYADVAALRADVDRCLAGEALAAGPRSRRYRLGKLAARHRPALFAAAAVALAVACGFAGTAWFAVREAREATRARAAEARALRASYAANVSASRMLLRAGDGGAARERLDATPPGLRNFEWGWLRGRTEGATRVLAHGGPVEAAAFSPDGRWVLTGSADRAATLWDARSGERAWAFTNAGRPVRAVAFSPGGGVVLAVDAFRRVHTLDAATGEPRVPPLRLKARPELVSFRADGGRFLAAGRDGELLVASVTDAADRHALPGLSSVVHDARFTGPGDRVVAVDGGGTLVFWDAAGGEPAWGPSPGVGPVAGARFTADGTRLALRSADGGVAVADAATGWATRPLPGGRPAATALAWSPAGDRLFVGRVDGTAESWSDAGGPASPTLRLGPDPLRSLVPGPAGRHLAAVSSGGRVRLADTRAGATAGPRELIGHRGGAAAVAFSPGGGSVVTASADGTARVWSVDPAGGAGEVGGATLEHAGDVGGLAFSPAGDRLLAVRAGGEGDAGGARIHRRGAPVSPLGLGGGPVATAAFDPGGARLLLGRADGSVDVLDPGPGGRRVTLREAGPPVAAARFGPDGERVLLVGVGGAATLHDASTGRRLAALPAEPATPADAPADAVFHPDGRRVLAWAAGGAARLWDPAVRGVVASFRSHGEGFTGAAISPDGRRIATGGRGGSPRIWDARTGQRLRTLTGPRGGTSHLAFSPDGRTLAHGGGGGAVHLHDVATGRLLRTLAGHRGGLTGLTFRPDGTRLATTSEDRTLRLWDPRTGEAFLEVPRDAVPSRPVFSPDGGGLAAASGADRSVVLWGTPAAADAAPPAAAPAPAPSPDPPPRDGLVTHWPFRPVLARGEDAFLRLRRVPGPRVDLLLPPGAGPEAGVAALAGRLDAVVRHLDDLLGNPAPRPLRVAAAHRPVVAALPAVYARQETVALGRDGGVESRTLLDDGFLDRASGVAAVPAAVLDALARNAFALGLQQGSFRRGTAAFLRVTTQARLGLNPGVAPAEERRLRALEDAFAASGVGFLDAFRSGRAGAPRDRLPGVDRSGRAALHAGVLLHLHRTRGGDAWARRFFRLLAQGPPLTRDTDAALLDQGLLACAAASAAAGEDLSGVYAGRWRLPLTTTQREAFAATDWAAAGRAFPAAFARLRPAPAAGPR